MYLVQLFNSESIIKAVRQSVGNKDACLHQASQFCTSTLLPVMAMDSLLSSHPIIQPVETPDQINAIFDKIAYDKVYSWAVDVHSH